jgi:ABC-2 type transport system permease protein
MSGVVFTLTMRQLLGRGRTILMLLLALVPLFLAAIVRLASPEGYDHQEFVADGIYEGFVITLILPLVALVYGTAVLGAEIEDGTAVYVLSKPITRVRIVFAKLTASWLATSATVAGCALPAALIAIVGESDDGMILAFTIGIVLGALAYSALFIFLSVLTSRALIAGLAYVFIWEGLINGLFDGTRLLSVRHYTLGIADAFTGVSDRVFEASLSPTPAIVAMALMAGLATWLAIRRLERFEIGETS